MLLTISTTHRPATDLGFLLHKHPDRVQTFSTGFGEAHVFYPEASEERCTAALLLAIDPVGLVRRGRGVSSFALAEYVNDRPSAYRRYVWPVNTVSDLRLAPFHVLAAETGVFIDRGHDWHLQLCDQLVVADPGWFTKTDRLVVDATDPDSQAAGIAWWEQLTGAGGEGMVVKPSTFTARGRKGLVQPGIKCRGREDLRIIYGPEYADPSQLGRLRSRSLGRKRSLAIREFALGAEALERFVRREPLYRVHECVFGVLAMESEPVDPRL